jgi:hypothetical protein
MRKTFTAGLTALSLILIPAAPVQAENNDTLNHAILGLLAAGAIGLAINESKSNKSSSVQVHRTTRHANQGRFGNERRTVRRRRHVDPLPSRCFRQVKLGNGRIQNVFTSRCLDRRYDDVNYLPRNCQTRIGGRGGNQRGYEANCLREHGYRSDRRN